jgi:phosphoglycolate phosphatase
MPSPFPRPSRLFLFDLDGTLIDSREDIARSLNLALTRAGLRPLPASRIASFVGNGVRRLVERSLQAILDEEPSDPAVLRVMELYLEEYGRHLLDTTCLLQGVKETLERLDWASLAVVTNKPERFSRRILSALGIGHRFRLILGGDSMPLHKPDPAPLLEAMARCGAASHETVMVGDSPVDIHAGRAAGTITCGIAEAEADREKLRSAGCNLLVRDIRELVLYFGPPAEA